MLLSSAIVEFGNHHVCGLVVIGETQNEALSVAEIALRHFETPGPKRHISVAFGHSNSPFDGFSFSIKFGDAGDVEISNVEDATVSQFFEHISQSPGYFITIGYMRGGEVVLEDPSKFFLVKYDIVLPDGYTQTEQIPIDWEELKEGLRNA